jgi:hypothetical protein
MHLPKRRSGVESRSAGVDSMAPNELIASTMRLLPWRSTTAAISGERIQDAVDVSQ